LQTGSFSLLYSDTDSLSIALTGDLDDLVKPEMAKSWIENKFKWYLADDSIEELRSPGKFKPEFITNIGRYVGVSPKCYILSDENQMKLSAKGVPNSAGLESDDFIGGIYNGEKTIMRTFSLINYSQITQTMVTRPMRKKCINSCYLKFQAAPNLNNLYPLRLNNKLL